MYLPGNNLIRIAYHASIAVFTLGDIIKRIFHMPGKIIFHEFKMPLEPFHNCLS